MGENLLTSIREYLKNPNAKRIAASVAGALAGFAYYHYIGCASGTCPITGNPYISTAYGALLGYLLVPKQKIKQNANNGGTTEA
jgi:Family of unknown function (DUF6132)